MNQLFNMKDLKNKNLGVDNDFQDIFLLNISFKYFEDDISNHFMKLKSLKMNFS